MSHSLVVLLALIGASRAGSVSLDGATWRALSDRPPEARLEAPGVAVSERSVTMTPVEGGLLVSARWTLRAAEPGWFTGVFVGPGAHVGAITWDGGPANATTTSEGTVVAGFVEGVVAVTLEAFVPSEGVALLPAVRGTVRFDGSALSADGALALSDGVLFLTGAGRLEPTIAPPSGDAGDLFLAHAGIGVTVGDAETTLRARVGWVVRRGHLDAVAIAVSGLGDDLALDGPNVASWRRDGDRIEITLREPAYDRVDVSLSATTATPPGTEATLTLPRIEPLGAFRTESTVQIAREEGLEVAPTLTGWQAVPSTALPGWGRDLVIAAPTAAYRAGGTPSGSLSLLRFQPLPLPPLVIDVADHRVATTAEGRVIARALYEIRNERAPWLRIVPPEGWEILGVRVSGDTARPVTDGGPGWLVPLPRSVDTVQGLLSFPVEVAFLGEGSPWTDATETTLALPSVDAEVADWRATLFLPPGFRSRMEPGTADLVESFEAGGGIVYGVSIGGAKVAEADALFEDAVSAWLDNDFEEAQGRLDTLRAIGGEGENLDKLQSNLDLITGSLVSDDYGSRQIRSQARARAMDEEREMKDLEKKAEERTRAGDYSAASGYWSQALEIGETLEQLEGDESVEVASSNQVYRENLDVISKDQTQRAEVLGAAATTLPWDVEGEVAWDTTGDVDWDVDGQPDWVPEEPADGFGMVGAAGSGGGHGAVGGVVGGVAGGVIEGRGYSSEVTITEDSAARMPVSRDARRSSSSAPGRAASGRGGAAKARPGAPAQDALGYDDDFGTFLPYEDLPEPVVHASALSITIPEVGQTLRYQRRLVPADDAPALEIQARITARERRNS